MPHLSSTRHNSRMSGTCLLYTSSGPFHQKREALIEKIYNADEIGQRILNGDGGSWIKETYDPEVIFQLDRFHIYKEIREKIQDEAAQEQIKELLEEKKVDELLEYIQIYADSIENNDAKDKGSEKARKLYQYLCLLYTSRCV